MSSDTPSKRQHRQTRNSAHTSIASTLTQHGQKSHHVTSQTIIASVESDCIVPSTPPRTPHKNDPLTTQTKSRSVPPESQQHQKSKNKSRPKNASRLVLLESCDLASRRSKSLTEVGQYFASCCQESTTFPFQICEYKFKHETYHHTVFECICRINVPRISCTICTSHTKLLFEICS